VWANRKKLILLLNKSSTNPRMTSEVTFDADSVEVVELGLEQAEDDQGLAELEERVEQGVFQDYRAAGDALRQIRDERLYKKFGTFQTYLRIQLDMARSTAYAYMAAAEVAADVHHVGRLTLRHALLLYRFDLDTRRELAPKIALLSIKEAEKEVKDRAAQLDEQKPTCKGKPRHQRDPVKEAISLAEKIVALGPEAISVARDVLGRAA
jgi:hypothetical protein